MKFAAKFSQGGFTFVELIIVSVLMMLVGGAFLTTFLTSRRSYLTTDANLRVQFESRRALDDMTRELRQSGNVSTTNLANGAIQLNFQIARGYNQVGCEDAVCWGSDAALGGWVHYSIIGNAGNERQLIRCENNSELTAVTTLGNDCRVLANHVRHPNSDNSAAFVYNAADNTVTLNLEIQFLSEDLGTGGISSDVFSTVVSLRNE